MVCYYNNVDNQIVELNCKRCGHKWIPRKIRTMVCPKCHSPYWNTEKVKVEES